MTSESTLGIPPLLPIPRRYRRTSGSCQIGAATSVEVRCDDARLERRFRDWTAGLDATRGNAAATPCRRIRVTVDRATVTHADGFHLHVAEAETAVTGGSPAGCFYGLVALQQLAAPSADHVPCCEIDDWPDFRTRGILHDVTRGKVPTLKTLMALADRLAALRVNQLQLYIEHAFVFTFNPRICSADEGMTPDEVRDLDRYCRDRFIDLVPALATFGHMGRILSMEEYGHLAEVEASVPWHALDWQARARGLTLDCMNEKAHRLVEQIWSDVLEAFSSPVVNICGDEPWDLGRGKNARLFEENRVGEAYVEHLCRTNAICAARGRRTQFWGDIIRNHVHLLNRLPADSMLLHWGYDDKADYAGTAAFAATGREVMVCPGTSGWKRILNAMDAAERNIATFANAGIEHGAAGLLTTDWGDHGHFNSLACSWHGISLGAALAWRVDHPTGARFDQLFARLILGAGSSEWVSDLRNASHLAGGCETWRLLWRPLQQVGFDPSLPSRNALGRLRESAAQARRGMEKEAASGRGNYGDWAELITACSFLELWAERMQFVGEGFGPRESTGAARSAFQQWADRLFEAGRMYAENWHARNKPGGLSDILTALQTVGDEVLSRTA